MYPDIFFPKLALQVQDNASKLALFNIPPIIKDRNALSWHRINIDLRQWSGKLKEFKACRGKIERMESSRVGQQLSRYRVVKKNSPQICRQLVPLVKAGMHARWLEIESGICDCLMKNDMLAAALLARGLVEEADRCQLIDKDLKELQSSSLRYSPQLRDIMHRLYFWGLPRLRPRTMDEMKVPVPRRKYEEMDQRLSLSMQELNDYVHPNYGSHVALLRPLDSHVLETLNNVLIKTYEIFFEIDWLCVESPAKEKRMIQHEKITTKSIIEKLEELFSEFQKQPKVGVLVRDDFDSLIEYLNIELWREENADNDGAKIDIETELLNSIRELEFTINQKIKNNDTVRGLLKDAYALFKQSNVLKMQRFQDQCLQNIVRNNPITAATFARAFVEHNSVQTWLDRKSTTAMEKFIKSGDPKHLKSIEQKLAKCLVGGKSTAEISSAQKEYWDEMYGLQKVNLMEAVKSSEVAFIGMYDYLSGVLHGFVMTGGDLLGGEFGSDPVRTQTNFRSADALGRVYSTKLDSARDTILMGHHLDEIAESVNTDISDTKLANKLKMPDQLKTGKDYFGSGTEQDPFSFRSGLLYYEVVYKLLEQRGFDYMLREVFMFDQIVGDKWIGENKEVLFTKSNNRLD